MNQKSSLREVPHVVSGALTANIAQRIVAALEARGLSPKIDTRDLPKLEDWRRELLGFIREADARRGATLF
jgi:hypothetical protein